MKYTECRGSAQRETGNRGIELKRKRISHTPPYLDNFDHPHVPSSFHLGTVLNCILSGKKSPTVVPIGIIPVGHLNQPRDRSFDRSFGVILEYK